MMKEDLENIICINPDDETENEDEESYVGIEDDEELNAVFQIFKDKFKDEFNFIDED